MYTSLTPTPPSLPTSCTSLSASLHHCPILPFFHSSTNGCPTLPLQVTLAVLYACGLVFVAVKVYGYLRRSGRNFCTLPVSVFSNSLIQIIVTIPRLPGFKAKSTAPLVTH